MPEPIPVPGALPLDHPADAAPTAEPHRTSRETFGGMIMLLQGLILFVAALVVVATPHSVCHTAASGMRRCGQSGAVGPALALVGGAAV